MWANQNKRINVVVNDFFHELRAIDNEAEYSKSFMSESPAREKIDLNKNKHSYVPIIPENASITRRNYPLTER